MFYSLTERYSVTLWVIKIKWVKSQKGANLIVTYSVPRWSAGDTYHARQPARRCEGSMSGQESLGRMSPREQQFWFSNYYKDTEVITYVSAADSLTSVNNEMKSQEHFLTLWKKTQTGKWNQVRNSTELSRLGCTCCLVGWAMEAAGRGHLLAHPPGTECLLEFAQPARPPAACSAAWDGTPMRVFLPTLWRCVNDRLIWSGSRQWKGSVFNTDA